MGSFLSGAARGSESTGGIVMHFRRGLTLTAATGAALIFAGTPAFAGSSIQVETTNGAGAASFHSTGETVTVCDFAPDGKRVTAYISAFEPSVDWTDSVSNAKGSGGGCVSRDFNIAEGSRVLLRVCLQDGSGGPLSNCSSRKEGRA
ncbi:hypothetical protein [Streptomyces sp. NBC_01794]|uniref:hypothetical protein n=2 Tax=Streptomyces TaxID=1883 RepID=UPI0038731D75